MPSNPQRLIFGFRNKRAGDFAAGKRVNAFSGVAHSARMKLDRLESITSLSDLAALPGNRFEVLRGDRKRQYSILIKDQWRICFGMAQRSAGTMERGDC